MNLKLSLGLTLAIIAALIFGYFCFTGLYFSTGGNFNDSILFAAIYAAVPLILGILLWRFKTVSRNFKTYIILETIALIAFIVSAVWFFPKYAYSFTVSVEKESVQKELIDELTAVETMYSDYEAYVAKRYENYNTHLQHIINNKPMDQQRFLNCGFIHGDENKQKNHKLFVLKNELQPKTTYDNVKNQNLHWIKAAKKNVADWKSMGVVETLAEIDSRADKWRSELIEFSKQRMICEHDDTQDFTYTFNFKKMKFEKKGGINTMAIGTGILLYLVMLVPYFVGQRSSRAEGKFFNLLKSVFTTEKRENEL